MNHILKMLSVVLVLFAVTSVSISIEADDAAEKAPDGSIYVYETHGSAHPNYYCTIIDVMSISDVLYLPTVLEGYDVRYIAEGALNGCDASSIIVPAGVHGMFDDLSGCTKLKDIYFLGDRPATIIVPEGVEVHHPEDAEGWATGTIIEERILNGIRYGLFPDGWMVLGGEAIDGAIVIDNTIDGIAVVSVGPYAFAGMMMYDGNVDRRTDIQSVSLPEGLTDVRERSFYYCDIQQIDCPSTLKSIHDEAFRAAYSLNDPEFNEGLRFIGFESFRDCHSITSIHLPDTLKDAGEGCFKLCTALKDATLGKGMLTVPPSMFFYDSELESVAIHEGAVNIGQQAFYNCSSLTSIRIPGGMNEILGDAFRGCISLNVVDLNRVSKIGVSAFRDCISLESITLPSTVKSLDPYCFADCLSLRNLYSKGQCPEGDDTVFLNDTTTVHCDNGNERSWKDSTFGLAVVNDCGSDFNLLIIGLTITIIAAILIILFIRYRNHPRFS